MKTIEIFGFNLFSDNLNCIPIISDKCRVINTMSPNSYGITTKDIEFRESLQKCDYLVLDGVYFALASQLLKGKNIKKNQGPDVFYHFMNRLNEQNGKAFFLGSTNISLNKIKEKTKLVYPNVNIEVFSPPFKPVFSRAENDKIIESINTFKPNIVFVGMTCPKQEKWAYFNKDLVNANLICSIGAVFDWYAGTQPEISKIWWTLRLGWVKRIIDRPEVFKRNLPNVMIFLKHLFLSIIGFKKK